MALPTGDEVPDFTAGSTAIDAEWIESLRGLARAYLERKTAALSEEVRHYPRPIARCDEQLPALLESRARALAQLERLRAIGDRELARADCIALAGTLIDALAERPAA